MQRRTKNKLYCYVDETGQDTGGIFFIVGLVVMGTKREELERQLETIESTSRKQRAKWTDAHYLYRRQYIEGVLRLPLRHGLFFKEFGPGNNYLLFTAESIAATLRQTRKDVDRATVYVDGFPLGQVQALKRQLRPSLPVRIYVKAIALEESSALMRLADAICGLVRDSTEGHEWSQKAVQQLRAKGFLKPI